MRKIAGQSFASGAQLNSEWNRLNDLAVRCILQGKNAEGEQWYKRALAFSQKRGGAPLDLASSLYNVAQCYTGKGEYGLAEPLYKQALEIRKKTLSPNHLTVATSSYDLAYCYLHQGKVTAAVPLFKRAMEIARLPDVRERTLDEGQLAGLRRDKLAVLGLCLINMAFCYILEGKNAEVDPLYRQLGTLNLVNEAFSIEKTFSESYGKAQEQPMRSNYLAVPILQICRNFGAFCRQQGKIEEAERLEAMLRSSKLAKEAESSLPSKTGLSGKAR